MNDLSQLLRSRIPGKSLPQAFYVDPELFEKELYGVFHTNWLFAGHTCEIPEPGDYFLLPVGEEELIVLRDKEGGIRAHFNVCRHRGSRIATERRGRSRSLVCPYHQWVYKLDGCLANARLMGEAFDADEYRLRSAAVRELAGLVFVCLSPNATTPDFDAFFEDIEPQLRPHGLERAKVAVRHSYEVTANWKTLVENNRECYHCRVSHPEFCMSNYDLGLPGDTRNDAGFDVTLQRENERWRDLGLSPEEASFPGGYPHRVSRLPLKEGFLTESLDGDLVAPLMGELTDPRTGSLRIITLPNLWAHANCDYAMTTRLLPVSPGLTRVEVCFLVREDAVEGVDYDPERVAAVWKTTCEQDWELCENNFAGIKSVAYEPGPFSEVTESSVEAFLRWYLGQLGDDDGGARRDSTPRPVSAVT
ncbi:MAG: aromatic ring-hydroxylating dioxygenase subunit alpha [Actinomycetota bacterium]|nr:aromatic ring-hydroxylating dioxygenase subunit alpha [Actinomycetota bacterium]